MKFLGIAFIFLVIRQGACDAVCTEPGRFPSNTRDDCRGYMMCLKGATSITHYNLVCPENTIYSHIDNQCTNVTSYQCYTNYTCSGVGNIVNDLDENCFTYISCVQDLSKIVSARLVRCPGHMVFSATESVCVNSISYNCSRETPKVFEVSVHDTDVQVTGVPSGSHSIRFSLFTIVMLLFAPQFRQ
ncbi:uncharacterized protein LOC121728553 [Aricia agestis]|uniref:uncharacterized protein LOC121728553 n=1 Tax=Aricia agestis TaxID=91739 RepID=UPI001C20A21D|nr:uncharacterized protein LOC121728553 [Aricia agestis]